MRHVLAALCCALLVSLFNVSIAGADVVTFGSPSATTFLDGDTISWTVDIPGDTGPSWSTEMAYHAINTKGAGTNGRVVPSTQGHAINTKGAGTNGRFYFPPPTPVGAGTLSLGVKKSPTLSDPTLQILVTLTGTNSSGDSFMYQPVLFTWQATPLNGASLSSAPSIRLDSDADGIGFSDDVSLDLPGGTDSSTETWQWTLSAETVPEPASGSIVIAALVGLAHGRGRFTAQ